VFGLSIGFYRKRLTTALLVGVLAVVAWVIASRSISADSVPFDETIPGQARVLISVDERGGTTVNGAHTASIIQQRPTSQRLTYIATDAQGRFIDRLTVVISLPTPITADDIHLNSIGAYGIGESVATLETPTQLKFEVTDVSPQAIYTIEADLPPAYFALPKLQTVGPWLTALPFTLWMAIGLIFPLIALIVLAVLVRESTAEWRGGLTVLERRDTPPAELPPAFAGVIVLGKLTPRMLAATLLDLAEREFVVIGTHGDTFTFGKRRAIDGSGRIPIKLASFEQILLDKLFLSTAVKSTQSDIDIRLGQRLFSRKIAEVYVEVYDQLTGLGYFRDNPNAVWQRYRTMGISLFFLALLGFTLTLLFMSGTKFPLVSWVGMMAASLLVMRGAPLLPRRTAQGIQALREWTAFRNWLSAPEAITTADAPERFRRYLPYAIALGVEVEWTRRFAGIVFQPPNWLVTPLNYLKIDDFAQQVFPIVGYVATQFAAVRDPNS